jgi:hypothetical protein
MDSILELLFHLCVELYHWRKRRNAKPIPRIVGSVPYCPLKR